MKNYHLLTIDCCSNCRWADWYEDGCGFCLLSKITEVDLGEFGDLHTHLSLEFIEDLGICDLYEKREKE